MLRFSRLFGPGKPSSLPQIWRNIRKKRKKEKRKDSDTGSDDEKPKAVGWKFNYADVPPQDQWASDDEDKLLKPVDLPTKDVKKEVENKDDTGPKVGDWRFGPAQIWYDMLEVPETGDDFDYGFKVGTIWTNNLTRQYVPFSAYDEIVHLLYCPVSPLTQ